MERLSRGLILAVDEHAMTASLLRQYTHPKVLSGSQGSVQVLANGNVFVCWGETPRVSEFDPSGRIVFDALLGHSYECYRAFRLPWSGIPTELPALALAGRTAYASWNGATGVAAWELLGGSDAGSLTAISRTPARGFETAIPAAATSGSLAVQALDRSGARMGRSATVSVAS